MTSRQIIANFLTVAAGIVLGFLSFCIFLLLASDWFGFYERDVPNYCWRFLLWPGYLMGRIGFSYTIIAVLTVGIVGCIFIYKYLGRFRSKIRKFFYAFLLILLYEILGFSYFYWFPVPKPAFSLSSPVDMDWDTYIEAYELGYRCGIVDMPVSYHWPGIAQEVIEGYLWGYEHGVSEWESIFPGIFESETRELFDRFSNAEINPVEDQDIDASEGISMREFVPCRIEYTEIGRRARFSGSAIFRATVNAEGVIENLERIEGIDSMYRIFQVEQFESCIKRWRFNEQGEYTLILNIGTTDVEEGLMIKSVSGDKSMIVRLF